jgi:hypothetical protein
MARPGFSEEKVLLVCQTARQGDRETVTSDLFQSITAFYDTRILNILDGGFSGKATMSRDEEYLLLDFGKGNQIQQP